MQGIIINPIITGIVILLPISYVVGDCGLPPAIKFSRYNVTKNISEKSVIEYSCFLEYRPIGNATYTCSDGEWTGGPFSCDLKKCLPLGSPKNGRNIGNGTEIGYVMRFECNTGYELIGSATSQCRLDLKWQPVTIPECRRRQCQKDLFIEHGNVTTEIPVDGQSDVYGATLRVHCDEGYIRSGPVRVHCNKNGHWTEKPKCKPFKCPPYPGLDGKCVEKTKMDYQNTLLLIFCTPNSLFIHHGDRAVRCENNTWDDLSHGCFCDCKVRADNDRIYFHNLNSSGLLKHNETLLWSCEDKGRNYTGEPLTCNDGMIKTPICPDENNVAKTDNIFIIYVMLVIVIAVILVAVCVCCKVIHPWYRAKSSGTNRNGAPSLLQLQHNGLPESPQTSSQRNTSDQSDPQESFLGNPGSNTSETGRIDEEDIESCSEATGNVKTCSIL